ncbi:MAG TPA: hypothetical protein VGY13_01125 [Solirubrobacteraceae bacterium]|nr:hypothetical protein [Solirubrobacteraceae bacterium]
MGTVGRIGRRNALLALAAAVATAGILVAVLSSGGAGRHPASATGPGARHPRPVGQAAAAASYLGISRAQLRSKLRSRQSLGEIAAATPGRTARGLLQALLAARTAQLEDGALSRRLSPAAREARIARLRARLEAEIERLPGYADLAQSARYLGLPLARLRADLRAGRSLAQIAGATPGKSAAGLVSARVRSREAALRAAVASHALNRATASALVPTLRKRIELEVERVPGG